MKSDLDLIIDFYEEEKLSLEQSAKEALAEYEYESVYRYGDALNKVRAKLYQLNILKDPLYEKIEQLERLIAIEQSTDGISERWKEHYQLMLEKRKVEDWIELEKLRTQKREPILDSQDIDDALFALFENKCRAFGFYFPHRDDNLCLLFELTAEKMLSISLDLKDIASDYDPDDPEEKQIHLFKNLGFRVDDYSGSLVYKYNVANFNSAWDLKILLARIIYDIGYLGQEKQGTLEFYD